MVATASHSAQLGARGRIQGVLLVLLRYRIALRQSQIGDKSTHLFGDGMAVWVTKDRAQPGPVFGSKGAP